MKTFVRVERANPLDLLSIFEERYEIEPSLYKAAGVSGIAVQLTKEELELCCVQNKANTGKAAVHIRFEKMGDNLVWEAPVLPIKGTECEEIRKAQVILLLEIDYDRIVTEEEMMDRVGSYIEEDMPVGIIADIYNDMAGIEEDLKKL